MRDITQLLASELDRSPEHIGNVIRLLDEGNTIPFIARYRKELHGAMDDTALRKLEERLAYLRSLEDRCAVVRKAVEEQGKGAIASVMALTKNESLKGAIVELLTAE